VRFHRVWGSVREKGTEEEGQGCRRSRLRVWCDQCRDSHVTSTVEQEWILLYQYLPSFPLVISSHILYCYPPSLSSTLEYTMSLNPTSRLIFLALHSPPLNPFLSLPFFSSLLYLTLYFSLSFLSPLLSFSPSVALSLPPT
jgi:hypothetical protein